MKREERRITEKRKRWEMRKRREQKKKRRHMSRIEEVRIRIRRRRVRGIADGVRCPK